MNPGGSLGGRGKGLNDSPGAKSQSRRSRRMARSRRRHYAGGIVHRAVPTRDDRHGGIRDEQMQLLNDRGIVHRAVPTRDDRHGGIRDEQMQLLNDRPRRGSPSGIER